MALPDRNQLDNQQNWETFKGWLWGVYDFVKQFGPGQPVGAIGYATYADLAADLTPPANTVGAVTNDSDPTKNGFYRKTGASGSGSWVKSDISFSAMVDVLSSIKTLLAPNPNLFNPAAVTTGNLINNSTGALSASASFTFATDYIPVVAGGSVTANFQPGADPSTGLAFYTSGKVFISGSRPAANAAVSVPSNAAYVRYSFIDIDGTAIKALQIVPSGAVNTPFKSFGVTDPYSARQIARGEARLALSKNVNIFDPRAVTPGRYYDNNAQAFATFAPACTSDYMPVTGGGKIIWSTTAGGYGGFRIAFFDANKAYCGGISGAPTSGTAFDVPVSAAFAILSMSYEDNTLNRQVVIDGDTLPAGSPAHGNYAGEFAKVWAGKRLGVIGDSISTPNGLVSGPDDKMWRNIVCNYLRMVFQFDNGVSSRTMSGALDDINSTIANQLDLLTVFLGTNDYALNTPMGAITDATTATTFYGYTKKLIEQIYTWNPAIRLAFLTPVNGPRGFDTSTGAVPVNGGGKSLYDYSDALKAVCKMYSVPCFDLLSNCGVNYKNYATYLVDSVHPNVAGHAVIGRTVAKWLETV